MLKCWTPGRHRLALMPCGCREPAAAIRQRLVPLRRRTAGVGGRQLSVEPGQCLGIVSETEAANHAAEPAKRFYDVESGPFASGRRPRRTDDPPQPGRGLPGSLFSNTVAANIALLARRFAAILSGPRNRLGRRLHPRLPTATTRRDQQYGPISRAGSGSSSRCPGAAARSADPDLGRRHGVGRS